MSRLSDLARRPGTWIGLLGALLLIVAAGWSITERFAPSAAAACPEHAPSGPADGLRIIGIGAAELVPGGAVCLAVDNVVSAAALRPRRAALTQARAELAAAREALTAAEAPPRPIPSWERRYGVKPLTDAQLAERRGAARARVAMAERRVAALASAAEQGAGGRRLVLFVNDERVAMTPRAVRGISGPQTVTFAPLPASGGAAAPPGADWRYAAQHSEAGLVPVTLGIGYEGQSAPTAEIRATPARNGGTSERIALRVYRPAVLWLTALGLVLLLAGLASHARSTALLRDGRSRYSTYSLSRIQLAWWFAVTLSGFLFVWIVTGHFLDVVGSATFVLLGIAGATAGVARVVTPPRTGTEPLTRGFFADIAGGDRVELHRLQMIAWTVVLGGIYVWNVLVNFTLTDFDGNLLALAAVVNGVYAGLKTQEA